MSIECPHCSSYNADGALHCDQCGGSLAARGSRGGAGVPPWLFGLVLILAGVGGFFALQKPEPTPTTPGTPVASEERPSRTLPRSPTPNPSDPRPAPPEPIGEMLAQDRDSSTGRVVAGWLQIEDPHGFALDRQATAVSKEGWLALLRTPSLGGGKLLFRPGLGGETTATEGVASPRDALQLWKIESPDLTFAPPLEPFDEGDSVVFLSYSGNRREEFEVPRRLSEAGLFLRAEAPFELASGGVLLQGGAMVGWGTGDPEPALWFWNGESGADLTAEGTVEEFYDQTFAGGQEEKFAAAHALAESSASRRSVLEAFSEALRWTPRLRAEEQRDRWRAESAVLPVARAMRDLLDRGAPGSILEVLDLETVRRLADAAVFLLFLDAVAAVDGAESAIGMIDRYGNELVPAGHDLEEQLVSRLLTYLRDALALAVDRGDLAAAWSWVEDGRRRFPDDSDLYLWEVELWLGEGDWRRAEEMLNAVSFPASFRERVARLERLISELKGEEGRIVIRFRPGASSITTHADLSGVEQLFIVDTGASYTSIPWSTVRSLGIRVDSNTPRRQLRTASDIISVPVVVLPEVTLGGWTVQNVEATVLDLPGNDALGLLGLNFLGEFKVEVDRERGTLTLEPK